MVPVFFCQKQPVVGIGNPVLTQRRFTFLETLFAEEEK